MDPDSIGKHLSGDPDAAGTERGGNSIGIANVNQRISLLFGQEYSLRIESRPGEGTRVAVRVPKLTLKEMRAYVQGHTGGR